MRDFPAPRPLPEPTRPPEPHTEVDGQQSLFEIEEDGSVTLNPEAVADGNPTN